MREEGVAGLTVNYRRWHKENGPFAMWHRKHLHPPCPKTEATELGEMVDDLCEHGHNPQCAADIVYDDQHCWCHDEKGELNFDGENFDRTWGGPAALSLCFVEEGRRMKLSTKFIHAVKLSDVRQYRLCQKAHPPLHPTVLSRLINGIEKVRDNDERVTAIGEVLGLEPGECFEEKTQPVYSCPYCHAVDRGSRVCEQCGREINPKGG